MKALFLLSVLLLVVGCAEEPVVSPAATPEPPPRILFTEAGPDSNGTWSRSIFSIAEDGSDRRKLAVGEIVARPAAGRMLFTDWVSQYWIGDLYVASVDGNDVVRIAGFDPEEKILGGSVALSPDGRRVAYLAVRGGTMTMVVVGSDGRGARSTPVNIFFRSALSFSPDGTRIAYFDENGAIVIHDIESGRDLVIADSCGASDPRFCRAYGGYGAGAPEWTASGSHLLFESGGEFFDPLISSVRADGSGLEHLTMTAPEEVAVESNPKLAPDQRTLLLTAYRSGAYGSIYPVDIWTVNLDGTGWKRWTGPEIKTSHSAEWSSDGSRFLHVTSQWLGSGDLVLVDRNDDTRTTITGNALHGYWSQ